MDKQIEIVYDPRYCDMALLETASIEHLPVNADELRYLLSDEFRDDVRMTLRRMLDSQRRAAERLGVTA